MTNEVETFKLIRNLPVTTVDAESILIKALEGKNNHWIKRIIFKEKRPEGETPNTWALKQLDRGKTLTIVHKKRTQHLTSTTLLMAFISLPVMYCC